VAVACCFFRALRRLRRFRDVWTSDRESGRRAGADTDFRAIDVTDLDHAADSYSYSGSYFHTNGRRNLHCSFNIN